MPDTPPVTPPDPAGWLHARVAELEADNARLRQAAADRDELAAAQLAARDAQIDALAALVEELQRLLGQGLLDVIQAAVLGQPVQEEAEGPVAARQVRPQAGKQPGAQSSTLKQSGSPDNTVKCGRPRAAAAGTTWRMSRPLAQKRQVFDAAPPPPPVVTEYQVLAKESPACGETSIGLAPAGVTGRVQYGPWVRASTALATCANYLPVARAAKLVAALTGVSVSAGFTATIRGKAAARLGPFMEPGPRTAARGRGAVRRRDPRPCRRAPALCPCGLHRVPHRDAHRGPDQRSDQRRRHPARLLRHHRPRRLQGI